MIEEEWKRYEAFVLPAGAPEVQRVECRRAFWAGAMACYYGVLRGMTPGEESTEADERFMEQIDAEFKAYAAECAKGAASVLSRLGAEIHNARPPMPALAKTCNRKDCGKPSEWQVGFIFFAAGHTASDQGMRAETGIVLCGACAKTAKIEDYVTDAGWNQICAMMKHVGKMPPERSATKLQLLPILRAGA